MFVVDEVFTKWMIYFSIVLIFTAAVGIFVRIKKIPLPDLWKRPKLMALILLGPIVFYFLTFIALFLCVVISGPP